MKTTPKGDMSFDEMEIAVFKVDDNVRVKGFNVAGSHLLVSYASRLLNARLGDALQCVHSYDTVGGCGSSPACLDCNIRKSIAECFLNKTVVRTRVEVELKDNHAISRHKFIITVNPSNESNSDSVVLIVEDLHSTLSNINLPLRINRGKNACDNRYHEIIEDHLIKYRTVTF
jgi:hypothetical protein